MRILFPGLVPRQYGSVIGVVDHPQATVEIVLRDPPVRLRLHPLPNIVLFHVLGVSVTVFQVFKIPLLGMRELLGRRILFTFDPEFAFVPLLF